MKKVLIECYFQDDDPLLGEMETLLFGSCHLKEISTNIIPGEKAQGDDGYPITIPSGLTEVCITMLVESCCGTERCVGLEEAISEIGR